MEVLAALTTTSGLIPHGFCINWTPSLLWSYVVSDALIVLAYYSIPFALAYFVLQRKDLKFRWIYLMFGAFIFACGTTHLMAIVLLWQPLYWVDVALKAATAVVSVITASSLIWIIPRAIRLPSPVQLEAEINERREAQRSLEASESRLIAQSRQLTTLIESIPDFIVLKDESGRWMFANKPAKALFHFDDIDWQGKTDEELGEAHPALSVFHSKCLHEDQIAWEAGKAVVFEAYIQDQQGNELSFEVRKAPIYQQNGQRKGMVIIGRDTTSIKRTEQYMRIADTAFESQEGILITDANNFILRINSAFTRLTGYQTDEVIGRTPAILKSGRHDKEFYRDMWRALKTERFWQGEVWDRRKNGEIYPKWLTITAVSGPGGEITNYVGAFTDLSQHKEAEEAIHRLAFYDPLTDLPNRRLLRDRLELALTASARSQHYGAVMLIDLDNFKTINDTRGHEIGDKLLVEVANRLKTGVRQGDTVSRLGGDEFVIMLDDLSTQEEIAATQAECISEKIMESVNQPYMISDHELYSSMSIGISLFVGHASSGEEIIKRADTAMYQAKGSGRNAVHFFDPKMQAMLENRMRLESDLRHALERQQLSLHYQLQIDHQEHAIGAEALLRWQHPQHGMISPGEFIPIAEENGMILPIGEWVIQTACDQLKLWEQNPHTAHLTLAINVSAKQFRQGDFVGQVCNILKKRKINANRLKLELTESVVLHNVNETITKMQALRLIGIRFSMDDFGTGYSSLSYLKKLPLNQLKIDKIFVQDIVSHQSDAVIAQTIIAMAKTLGLNVIAEGVETEEQRYMLEQYGCTSYQGYLFAQPLEISAFEQLVARLPALATKTKP